MRQRVIDGCETLGDLAGFAETCRKLAKREQETR
jgi:hypothetical protein